MRLDKLLTETKKLSRGQVKKLIRSKQVRVNGIVATAENMMVDANLQHIEVCGEKIIYTGIVYYMLHKPKGVVTAVKDAKQITVIDLINAPEKNLYPVGRLDKDTTGLVLITNNGPLGFKLLHPKYHVEKVYEVTVNGLLTQNDVDQFAQGIVFLDGTRCQPARLELLSCDTNCSRAKVYLSEGKFHQVKKMFLSVGKKVTRLKRIAFGPLVLDDDLDVGEYRLLTDAEQNQLKQFFN